MADDMALRMEQYRSHDDERHKFIEELFQTYQENLKKLSNMTTDYEVMRISCRSYRDQINKLQPASFALVLLDADTDGYFFEDSLIVKGFSGGTEAANKLRHAVREELVAQEPNMENLPIMIKAYICLDGARQAFENAKLGHLASQLSEFITGFNQVALCDFVCVGSGKDRADERIRGIFELFLKNPTCRHIAFAACHDNGYSRVLEQIDDDALKRKITLVEGFYTGREFKELGIRKTKVQGVFRKRPLPLPHRPVAAMDRRPQNAEVLSSGARISYSSAAGGSGGLLPTSIGNNEFTVVPMNGVTRSDARRSLDKRLRDGQRFCIAFLLKGDCRGSDACGYSHGTELSQEELELWKADILSKKNLGH